MERGEGDRFSDINFQSVSGITGMRNICDRIDSWLDLWNKNSYNKLVQDLHRAAEESSGDKRGTQTQEQRHGIFQTLKKR